MAFLDIKRASAGKSKMGAFILASCFIEYMAGFVAGKETNREDYKKFVKDYYHLCMILKNSTPTCDANSCIIILKAGRI